MATARDIMRGTFRLSVAVAVLAAAYGVYERMAAFSETKDSRFKMMLTLDCGARKSEETMKPAVNQYGLIDLGKVGCVDKQFLASFDELRQARDGVWRREWQETKFDVKQAAEYAFAYAVVALIAVNLLGLAFVAARAVFGWITAGYTPRA
jgi:hypothetical protein